MLMANTTEQAQDDVTSPGSDWMGLLTTSNLRADKPELLDELLGREDPLQDVHPMENVTVPHMDRNFDFTTPVREWGALALVKGDKKPQGP